MKSSQTVGYEDTILYSDLFNRMQPDCEIIDALLAHCQPKIIVEIGCGSGRLLPFYKSTNAIQILGIDIEKSMVEVFGDTDDARVKAWCGDIRHPLNDIPAGSLVVLTSSLLKHLVPVDRMLAWHALAKSVTDDDAIYVDHCDYIYGIKNSTNWQSYAGHLRVWWPESFQANLQRYHWRKEVVGQQDILEYRIENGATARIVTYIYPLDEFLADAAAAGFRYYPITDQFHGIKNLPDMHRRIGFLSRRSDDFWNLAAEGVKHRVGNSVQP